MDCHGAIAPRNDSIKKARNDSIIKAPRNDYFFSHCEEWNDEAVYGLPRADALAMTREGRAFIGHCERSEAVYGLPRSLRSSQ